MIRVVFLLLSALPLAAQTRSEVKDYLSEIGVKYVDVALAQAILESDNFKSGRFKRDHNIFGMKHPKKRKTTSIGGNSGWAKYKNWKDSCRDYLFWQQMHSKADTRTKYLSLLGVKYCPDKGYVNKVKTIMKQL